MAEDIGYGGSFVPQLVGESTLNELRNMAGPPPTPGKRWYMVDLVTGEGKWYQARQNRSPIRRKRRY